MFFTIYDCIDQFKGPIYQRPPQRSAVKRQTRIRNIYDISVLDDKINSVVIASGIQSTYRTSGTAITPGILEYYDDPDLISTIAPKPLYLSWGIHENSMFGYEAKSQYSASKIKNAYELHDKEENLTVVIHSHEKNGGHVYDIPSILEFLENSIKK